MSGYELTRTRIEWSAGLFSSSVAVEGPRRTIYLAGLADNDAADGHVVHVGDFAEQCRATYRRLEQVLREHGAGLGDVVKITAYVTDPENLGTYTSCRLEAFDGLPLPAHTFLAVKALAFPDMLVEVDATAVCALPG